MLGFYNYTIWLTCLGMAWGLAGIVCALEGLPTCAVACLMLAGFCDSVDGMVARTKKDRTREERYFGTQLDSLCDVVSLDGKVHDPNRIDYLTRYLRELRRAVDDGVDLRGYFQWSFMDNMEWARGYDERFGLVYVDFETQQRIPKDSAYWYKEVMEKNGENL